MSTNPPALAEATEHDARADQDARMTAARDEIKFVVAQGSLARLAQALGRKLPHHRFEGEGANRLPGPQHYVTTIYFDTQSRDQYRAALGNAEHNLKMRAKEYYDVHPSLAELATDASQIVRYQPVLWLELKSKHGVRTGKRRIGIPKRDVAAFFAQGLVTAEMIALQQDGYGADGERVLRELADYCRGFAEPMRADCLVNYRRLPWQSEDGELRVTLDVDLAYYPSPADLWQRGTALVRETLGGACKREAFGVLEVKARGAIPAWLRAQLAEVGADQRPFSKFEAASEAVRGALPRVPG
jgi:hypothetical protein